jgi:hypothetical protein
MSKAQFLTLNALGGLCAVLILGTVIFTQINARLNESLARNQAIYQPRFAEAQQRLATFENLAVRIAQGAQTNAPLLDLMKRHGVSVNLKVNGQDKQVP